MAGWFDRPWCAAYTLWQANNTDPNGEEPPQGHFIWDLWDLWDNKISMTTDIKKQNEYFRQILDIWIKEVPMICMLGEMPGPVIVKNGFKGYPNGAASDNTNKDEHTFNTSTYYWDNPSQHI